MVQRTAPKNLPEGVQFLLADLEDEGQTRAACSGADMVVCCAGIPYDSRIYARVWPVSMRNLLDGCAASGARFVFADSLYMYGPQTEPLREDLPLTDYGEKPRVRAEITRMWQAAHAAGRVTAVAVRASDFIGPDVPTSVSSEYGIARLIAGRMAIAPYPADYPHDFTYVPDFARALETVIDAPDDAYGQAWHVPNPPTLSLRQVLTRAAELAGVAPRIAVMPGWARRILGLFNRDLFELEEMSFQWDRPYRVDAAKFAARFWSGATPWDQALRETIAWYRADQDLGRRDKSSRMGQSGR